MMRLALIMETMKLYEFTVTCRLEIYAENEHEAYQKYAEKSDTLNLFLG
jgi:hypothetical protein